MTAHQVEDWFRDVVAVKNKMPGSFNKMRNDCGLFFRYCGKTGWVRENVMHSVPVLQVPEVERERLSRDKLLRLPELVSDPKERGFIFFAVNSGLRGGEITKIKVKDVDLAARTVYIYRSKTNGDDRIPITLRLDKELRVWLTALRSETGRRRAG